MALAMWLQTGDLAGTNHLIMIFIGLVAVAMAVQAIVIVVLAVKATKAVNGLSATADELKGKVLPLIDVVTDISMSTRSLLQDTTPKVKHITDNLVATSDTLVDASKAARAAVQQFDSTIADANRRAQRQVARVDGMVTAALVTTTEVVETISNGIRVPAQKIAAMATQARSIAEGILAKIKSATAGSRYGSK